MSGWTIGSVSTEKNFNRWNINCIWCIRFRVLSAVEPGKSLKNSDQTKLFHEILWFSTNYSLKYSKKIAYYLNRKLLSIFITFQKTKSHQSITAQGIVQNVFVVYSYAVLKMMNIEWGEHTLNKNQKTILNRVKVLSFFSNRSTFFHGEIIL